MFYRYTDEYFYHVNNFKLKIMKTLTLEYDQFMRDAEFNRFGIMAMCLLVNTGFGAIVCYAVSSSFLSIVPLIICAFSTTIPNVFGLAVSPMKWIVWSNVIGVVINMILLIATMIA